MKKLQGPATGRLLILGRRTRRPARSGSAPAGLSAASRLKVDLTRTASSASTRSTRRGTRRSRTRRAARTASSTTRPGPTRTRGATTRGGNIHILYFPSSPASSTVSKTISRGPANAATAFASLCAASVQHKPEPPARAVRPATCK